MRIWLHALYRYRQLNYDLFSSEMHCSGIIGNTVEVVAASFDDGLIEIIDFVLALKESQTFVNGPHMFWMLHGAALESLTRVCTWIAETGALASEKEKGYPNSAETGTLASEKEKGYPNIVVEN